MQSCLKKSGKGERKELQKSAWQEYERGHAPRVWNLYSQIFRELGEDSKDIFPRYHHLVKFKKISMLSHPCSLLVVWIFPLTIARGCFHRLCKYGPFESFCSYAEATFLTFTRISLTLHPKHSYMSTLALISRSGSTAKPHDLTTQYSVKRWII